MAWGAWHVPFTVDYNREEPFLILPATAGLLFRIVGWTIVNSLDLLTLVARSRATGAAAARAPRRDLSAGCPGAAHPCPRKRPAAH